jgi:hypothetical protein
MLSLRDDGGFEDVGREGRFAVIHQADDQGVELEDPAQGRFRMSRAELEDAWQGIVLCVAPTDEQAPRREGPLSRLRSWIARMPPLFLNVLGCVLLLALGLALAGPLGGRAFPAAVGTIAVALVASIWAVRTTARCAACAAAARDVGLPLAPLGILYYAGLLVALGVWGLVPLTVIAIYAAAGIHLALLARLAASGAHCRSCLLTAAAAWAASGLVLGYQGIHGQGVDKRIAVLPVAALGAILGIRLLTRWIEGLRQAKLDAVREVLAQESIPSPGSLRLIVYKHEACRKCQTLEKEILPPLAGMFGERLTIERRPAGRQLPAPTLFFLGGARRLAIIGLPDGDDLREALAG